MWLASNLLSNKDVSERYHSLESTQLESIHDQDAGHQSKPSVFPTATELGVTEGKSKTHATTSRPKRLHKSLSWLSRAALWREDVRRRRTSAKATSNGNNMDMVDEEGDPGWFSDTCTSNRGSWWYKNSVAGVPTYLADACIEAGPYILDLSASGQGASYATNSKGFVRAVRTLSRTPSCLATQSSKQHGLTSNLAAELLGDPSLSEAEAELRSRAIFMATRIAQAFPAIFKRVASKPDHATTNQSSPTSLGKNNGKTTGKGKWHADVKTQHDEYWQLVPADHVLTQLTELFALRLYTLWQCSKHGPGAIVAKETMSPLERLRLCESVNETLQRASLSLSQMDECSLLDERKTLPTSASTTSLELDKKYTTDQLSPFTRRLSLYTPTTLSSTFAPASTTSSPNHALRPTRPESIGALLSSDTTQTNLGSHLTSSASPLWMPRPGAHEAEYAVRYALDCVFGEQLSSARKLQLVERARGTIERCLISERKLSMNERLCMYRFQRLQGTPVAWENVEWKRIPDQHRDTTGRARAMRRTVMSAPTLSPVLASSVETSNDTTLTDPFGSLDGITIPSSTVHTPSPTIIVSNTSHDSSTYDAASVGETTQQAQVPVMGSMNPFLTTATDVDIFSLTNDATQDYPVTNNIHQTSLVWRPKSRNNPFLQGNNSTYW